LALKLYILEVPNFNLRQETYLTEGCQVLPHSFQVSASSLTQDTISSSKTLPNTPCIIILSLFFSLTTYAVDTTLLNKPKNSSYFKYNTREMERKKFHQNIQRDDTISVIETK
jgi:hypothetical protein